MKKVLGFTVALLAAIALWVAATNVNELPGLKVGDKAPDFTLKNVDGKMVSLKDYKDAKGFIVAFTCNTCPVAQAYEERIIDLHNKFAAKGYPVIAVMPNDPQVSSGDSFDKMQVRAKDKKYPFAYLFDDGQKVTLQYGATRTPEIYLLDKNLTVRYTGAIDDNMNDPESAKNKYVEAAVTALEKGQEPSPNFTKAVGCSVKFKKS
ncbi:MAG: thioredoxin family protein [Saprospiraceae bacterium]